MRLSEGIRKSQFPLMLALGSYGLSVLAFGYLAQPFLARAWLFPVAYLLFAWIGLALSAKMRVALCVIGTLCMFLLSAVCLEGDVRITALIMSAWHGSVLIWSMRFPGWEREKELPVVWLTACFVFLIGSYFCAVFEPDLDLVRQELKIALFLFVLFAMLSLNRSSWSLATGNRKGFFAGMRRKNVLLTLSLFLISLLISVIPSAMYLIQGIVGWISVLLKKLAELFPEETEPMETMIQTQPEMQETGVGTPGANELKQTSEALQAFLWTLAIIILLALVIGGAYMLGKSLYKLLKAFYHTLTDGITEEAEDFEDEISDTREEIENKHARVSLRRFIPVLGKMTPTQKIRHRYLRLYQKHPQWGRHSTARENLPETAAKLYEQARYSAHPVTDEDANRFKAETEIE